MLTKELIRARLSGDRIKPSFVPENDPDLLSFAELLLRTHSVGQTRAELDEAREPLLKSARDPKLANGLAKTILDHCDFETANDTNHPVRRAKIFGSSAKLLKEGSAETPQELRERVLEETQEEAEIGLYSDLPEHERLSRAPAFNAEELLARYNSSLVQSLLLHCGKIELEFSDPEPAQMRRLLKYLKFFRLLARFNAPEDKNKSKKSAGIRTWPESQLKGKMSLEIDGPASLFDASHKYGLQLACFFPAVCALPRWKMNAELKWHDKKLRLSLDQDSGPHWHYRNFGAYVPEEIKLFHAHFKEKVADWEIIGHGPIFDSNNRELFFPDFSFRHRESGKIIHLELFHRWHATQVLARLRSCLTDERAPLILGVERAIAEKAGIMAPDKEESFTQRGFLFRDFPGVERVKKLLDSNLQRIK